LVLATVGLVLTTMPLVQSMGLQRHQQRTRTVVEDQDDVATEDELEADDEAEGADAAEADSVEAALDAAEAEADVEGGADSEANAEVESTVHFTTARTAVNALRMEVSLEAQTKYKPFWGRTPECCLHMSGHDHVTSELYEGCTVYSHWACFPLGNICDDEPKPQKEPDPITYRVGVARADASLGPLVCNAGCPKCEKPRPNDVSDRILGSLKTPA